MVNTNTSSTNAALFGDDSDSGSEESVIIDNVADAITTTTIDPTTTTEAVAPSTTSVGDVITNLADEKATIIKNTTTTTNNSALFGDDGDDDDSSEDGEFDGGDDIVGRSARGNNNSNSSAAANAKVHPPVVVEKGMSMNQRLGLESDSDNENNVVSANVTTSEKGGGVDEKGPKKPIYIPPRRMELTNLPGIHDRIPTSTSSGNNSKEPIYFITKLPNLVAINPEPYHATTHDAEKEEEQYRGHVHNMIRWRYKTSKKNDSSSSGEREIMRDENGYPIRESNTRLIKWSDGSYTLHIGTEVLEVDNLDSRIPLDHPDESMAGFPGINGYLYVSQQASIRPPSKKDLKKGASNSDDEKDKNDGAIEQEDDDDEDDDTVPPQSAGTVLECIAPITSRLSCRPASLASEAHRSHTLAMRQRNVKRARIAEIVTEVDPEKEKLARIKGKDDMEKIRARHSGGGGGARRSAASGGGRRRGMNEGYLEEDDEGDYDGVNIGRLKKQTMRRNNSDEEEMDYGDDDDDEDDDEEDKEDWMTKRKQKRGAAAARAAKGENKTPATLSTRDDMESSEEGEVVFGDDDDDDDDEDDAAFVKKRGGRKGGVSKAVLSDDDDE